MALLIKRSHIAGITTAPPSVAGVGNSRLGNQLAEHGALSALLMIFYLRWGAGIAENFGVARLSEVAGVMLLATGCVIFMCNPKFSRNASLLIVGLMAWAGSGVLSQTANADANQTKAIALLALLALYALFANAIFVALKTPAFLRHMQRFFVLFLLVGCVLSLFQILSGRGFVESGAHQAMRAMGSDVHPVSFAIQIVAAVTALECTRLKLRQPFSPMHFFVLAAGQLALYLTAARTAWVMVPLIFGYYFWSKGSWFSRIAMVTFGVPIILLAFGQSARFADLDSLGMFWQNFSFQDVVFDYRYIDNSVSWRIVNWGHGLNQALERPLLGHGPGQSASASYFNLEMHNIFLETFFEGGLIGLTAFLMVIAGLVRLHRSLPNTSVADRGSRALANGFGVALLFAVSFSTSFVDQLMSFLLYILLLACAASPERKRC